MTRERSPRPPKLSKSPLMPRRSPDAQLDRAASATAKTRDRRERVREIIGDIADQGDLALRRLATQLDRLPPDAPLLIDGPPLQRAVERVTRQERELLERTVARIRHFAQAQRDCLRPLNAPVEGGRAGHDLVPLERVGLYAPAGRYPLVSSVLMTAIPARVAGVTEIILATPRPNRIMLAAAALAGVDRVLTAGGAQAIAAMALGTETLPAVDFIAGPGGNWVSDAKRELADRVRIDTLAGPSELMVVADASENAGFDAGLIAADLLAQAEHDPDARPMLILLGRGRQEEVERALEKALCDLPTAEVARVALSRGFMVEIDRDEGETAIALINRIAPEHLELLGPLAEALAPAVQHAGALFLGGTSAEALGDYGAGPNHTLPTEGRARQSAGLSVFDFLRARSWLALESGNELDRVIDDAAALARIEGLEAHARSAERRRSR